jgi:hypothetical protein
MTPRLGSALLPAADALRASLLQDVETPGADAQGGDAERQALVAARDGDPAPPRRLQSGLFDVSGRQARHGRGAGGRPRILQSSGRA